MRWDWSARGPTIYGVDDPGVGIRDLEPRHVTPKVHGGGEEGKPRASRALTLPPVPGKRSLMLLTPLLHVALPSLHFAPRLSPRSPLPPSPPSDSFLCSVSSLWLFAVFLLTIQNWNPPPSRIRRSRLPPFYYTSSASSSFSFPRILVANRSITSRVYSTDLQTTLTSENVDLQPSPTALFAVTRLNCSGR